MKQEKFNVTGMTCAACSAGIERKIRQLEGVLDVEVSLMGESMSVKYDENLLEQSKIMDVVLSLGYGISVFDENIVKERTSQTDILKSAL